MAPELSKISQAPGLGDLLLELSHTLPERDLEEEQPVEVVARPTEAQDRLMGGIALLIVNAPADLKKLRKRESDNKAAATEVMALQREMELGPEFTEDIEQNKADLGRSAAILAGIELYAVLSGDANLAQAEKSGLPDVGNLYARIVSLEKLPAIEPREGAAPIEVEIIDNSTLRLGGQVIRLRDHERYLFNALMLLRDQVNTATRLREFGFYPSAKGTTVNQAFSKSMNQLTALLNEAAGIEILKKLGQGRGTRYVVNPDLVLTDIRTEADLAQAITTQAELRVKHEARGVQFDGDLYKRIIDLGLISVVEVGEDDVSELVILDNTTLKAGAHILQLSRHQRYLLNALLLLRDSPASGAELRQFGFFPEAKRGYALMTFSKEMTALVEKLNSLFGIEILKKIGEASGMRYAVHSSLTLTDSRTEEDKASSVHDEPKKRGRRKKYPEFETASNRSRGRSFYRGPSFYGSEQEVEHDPDMDRRVLLITEMVQEYSHHPLVIQALGRIKNGSKVTAPTTEHVKRYLQEAGQYDLLDHADEVRLFKVLERGVNLHRDYGVTAENEQAIIDAVIARQIVYVSNLFLVIEHAKKRAWYGRGMTFIDYIQEGNIGIAEAIDRFDQSKVL